MSLLERASVPRLLAWIAALSVTACSTCPAESPVTEAAPGAAPRATEVDADPARIEALHRALREWEALEVERLLVRGVDPNGTDRGFTALQVAAAQGDLDIVERLLAAGAEVDRPGPHGRTPLHEAASCGALNVAWVLLEAGAQPDRGDDFGLTPLHLAAEEERPLVIDLLVWRVDEEGPGVNVRTTWGTTPLHHAAASGATRSVRWLLGFGARLASEVDARDDLGRTPLHLAAMRGDAATYRSLLARGADAEAVDELGQTPKAYLRAAADVALGEGVEAGPSLEGFDEWDGSPPVVSRYQDFPYGAGSQGLDFALWADGYVVFASDRSRPRGSGRLVRLAPEQVDAFLCELRSIGLLDLPPAVAWFETNHVPYAEVVVRTEGEEVRRRWCFLDPRPHLRRRAGSSIDRSIERTWNRLDLAIERLCRTPSDVALTFVRGYLRSSSQPPKW